MGTAQRLPNGNTLICDGAKGHAIEVTPEKEIVWEWLNTEFYKNKHRVTIYQMFRLPKNKIEKLL